jgi:hypothetical protein
MLVGRCSSELSGHRRKLKSHSLRGELGDLQFRGLILVTFFDEAKWRDLRFSQPPGRANGQRGIINSKFFWCINDTTTLAVCNLLH